MFLHKALESVINQTFDDWELIVIDDGSTDDSKEVILNYNNSKINYIYQTNLERSTARNNGIQQAKGDYICFLDSDDYFHENHLQILKNFIESTKDSVGVFMTNFEVRDEHDHFLKFIKAENLGEEPVIKIFEEYLTLSCLCCAHKNIFQEFLFNPEFSLWEDTHLWIRVLSKYPFYNIENATVTITTHNKSTVTEGFSSVKMKMVNQYIAAINDLFKNHRAILPVKITDDHRINYIDSKLKMYLYQSRQNKQYIISYKIWCLSMLNKPSFYLIKEFFKIPLSFLL